MCARRWLSGVAAAKSSNRFESLKYLVNGQIQPKWIFDDRRSDFYLDVKESIEIRRNKETVCAKGKKGNEQEV